MNPYPFGQLKVLEGETHIHIVAGNDDAIHVASVQRRVSARGAINLAVRYAHLFASAPKLLAELQRVHAALGGECFDWRPVLDAIAEATGPEAQAHKPAWLQVVDEATGGPA